MTFIPGRFFGILGIYGSGKTNLLAAIGNEAYTENQTQIIANFHLNFPHIYMAFKDIRKLLDKLDPALVGSIILLDELSTGADAYDFLATGPRGLAKLISQIRKAEMVCWYTDQRFGKIMKRLRDTTDGFVVMQDVDADQHSPDTDWHPVKRPNGRKCDGKYRRILLNDVLEIVAKPDVWDGVPFRHLYETHEIVAA